MAIEGIHHSPVNYGGSSIKKVIVSQIIRYVKYVHPNETGC